MKFVLHMDVKPALYAVVLFTALLQSFFGTMTGFVEGDSPFLYVFGKLAGLLALITWIWIAVLIVYSRRPHSTNILCRYHAHLTSFAVFGVAWLAIFIMLASQTPSECKGTALWCAAARFSTALAFFTSLFSIIVVCVVYRSVRASGLGLTSNVAKQ